MPTLTINLDTMDTSLQYSEPSEWPRAGAIGKAGDVMNLCKKNNIYPRRLLEVGAGDGAILGVLSENNFCPSMYAVEISDSGVSVINGQKIEGLQECKLFNGYTLDYPDDFFDLVILSHVIEHVEHERLLLREISRVSKYLAVEIPLDNPYLENHSHTRSLMPSYGHINIYTPKIIGFLLHTEGFHPVDDVITLSPIELEAIIHFEQNKHEKTEESVKEFCDNYTMKLDTFNNLSRREQENTGAAYCVLTRKISADEHLDIAADDTLDLLKQNKVHHAELLMSGYKGKAGRNALALEVSKRCRDEFQELSDRYKEFSDAW